METCRSVCPHFLHLKDGEKKRKKTRQKECQDGKRGQGDRLAGG